MVPTPEVMTTANFALKPSTSPTAFMICRGLKRTTSPTWLRALTGCSLIWGRLSSGARIALLTPLHLRRGPRELLEQQDERAIGAARDLLQGDLARPVAAQAAVERAAVELRRGVGQGGRRQLGVQEPAVAGHAAAGRARRDHHLIG